MSEKLKLDTFNVWEDYLQDQLKQNVQNMMAETQPMAFSEQERARMEAEKQAEYNKNQDREVMYALITKDCSRLGEGSEGFTERDERFFFDQASKGRVSDEDERRVVRSCPRPDQLPGGSIEKTHHSINYNDEKIALVAAMTQEDYADSERGFRIGKYNIGSIVSKCPTALDFEERRNGFIAYMMQGQGRDKLAAYNKAYSELRKEIYGIQSEYTDAVFRVRQEYHNYMANKEYQPIWEDMNSGERLFKSAHVCALSKNQITVPGPDGEKYVMDNNSTQYSALLWNGKEDGTADDAAYGNGQENVFAVFDGLGTAKNGRAAARTCMEKLADFMDDADFTTVSGKYMLLNSLNGVAKQYEDGTTTAVITKIVQNEGGKQLHFAAVGDSRLYIVHQDGMTEQITHDDNITDKHIEAYSNGALSPEYIAQLRAKANAGEMMPEGTIDRKIQNLMLHGVSKALGGDAQPNPYNVGVVQLREGDHIVLCSDGITGDVGKELRSPNQIGDLVKDRDAKTAAQNLMYTASKYDDRTAMVINV